ncbi:MAG TPA: 3-oxo-tetronate kinase [Ramlibacter sp.]|uniref:3-oxo-tetronate kinase n=1 Tax=Ramlibacter sp. TaxID=1917967 RepID=UPI002D7FEB94|nr:3-oxo-tetronate kinase [Ramlibacter sp.]HET8747074.1 3-oxo-tetronate kinase [Ramlibacter sp.]
MATTQRPLTLGVVADDFTGATDVASMLVRAGMRTVLVIGVPAEPPPQADAVVVALKSRTIAPAEAVAQSLAAWDWLRAAGARQCYFKYCSTFDSTPQGNIGPVTQALLARTGGDFTIACPAFPENGRTIYRGHLFVGDQLLSESGMRHHPLTPMTDANLVRVLQAQTQLRVGLLGHEATGAGAEAVRERMAALRAEGVAVAVADAVRNEDLLALAEACADLPLVTAGSGLALGLPAAYATRGWLQPDAAAGDTGAVGGLAAVLSGSCSAATNAQVQRWLDDRRPAWRIDPLAAAGEEAIADAALDWAGPRLADGPVLVYATASPDEVRRVQQALGVQQAGERVERILAHTARRLHDAGVRRFVVAGGESSGAVTAALGVGQLRIGVTIAPGVPWCRAADRPLALALKSGNFGTVDFFARALELQA